jgi:hypothetical protein
VSSEHATVETSAVPTVEAVPDRSAAPALATAELQLAPVWSREEDRFVTDPDGPDERRADAVAEALLAAAPPGDRPGDVGDLPGETPPSGVPLPPALRAWAERVTTADLHDVRLHRSPAHDRAAAALGARAFTRGRDVVLGPRVAPLSTASGLATLAHELGHVLAPPAGGRIGREPDQVQGQLQASQVVEWEPWEPEQDIEAVRTAIPHVLEMLADITWEDKSLQGWTEAERKEGAPERALRPSIFTVSTKRHLVNFNKDGVAVDVTDLAKPLPDGTLPRQGLIDLHTGRVWVLGVETRGDQQRWKLRDNPNLKASDEVKAGTSSWLVIVPAVELTEAQLKRFRQQAKVVAAKAAGPPGWSRDQVTRLRKSKAARKDVQEKDAKAADEEERRSTGDQEGEGGLGKQGTGVGGGGTEDSPDAKPGGDGRPLRGPASYDVVVGGDGNPVVKVTIDKATTYVGLKDGESTENLEKRVDDAVDELQESRDPAGSLAQTRDGATDTGFVQPKGSTQGVQRSAQQAEEQAKSTDLHTTPGEQVGTGKGGTANAPEYPSKIEMSSWDPETPATSVRGATNEFTMTVDYAARSFGLQDEVFNRMQDIQFYWEIIDVTGVKPTAAPLMSQAEAEGAAPKTGLGAGEQQTPGGALGTNFSRDMNAIAEDQEKDLAMMAEEDWPWEARAAYLGVIGISNVVRMLGSVIGSFIDTLTQPLNARSIGFDRDGDYIVRCVATPLVPDKARADPDHHVIRKSSIAVLPIRVQSLHDRATEAVDREATDLRAKEAALAAAQVKGGETDRKKAQFELDAAREAGQRGGQETYAARVAYLREQVAAAKALKKHRAEHAPMDDWSDAEVGLALQLFGKQVELDRHLDKMERALEAMTESGHETWVGSQAKRFTEVGGRRDFRPRVVLASEETGQVSEMLCMLGQLSPGPDAPWRWALVDITSPGTRDVYVGTSDIAGPAGRSAAIRAAFRDFAENAGYGRGTVAIRLPKELIDAVGPVDVEATMRSAPGSWARAKQRLSDLARVAGAVALFLTGPAAVAVGAIGGVAGAVVSVDALFKRSRTGHLMEGGTLFDVLGVLGGVASVISVGTSLVADEVNAALKAKALSGGAKELPKWVRNVQTIDRVVHVQGQVAGVLTLMKVPYDLVEEWGKIDASDASEGQKGSRKLRALLHGLETGAVTVAGMAGGFGKEPQAKPRKGGEEPPPGAGEPVPVPEHAGPSAEEPVRITDADAVAQAREMGAKQLTKANQAERETAAKRPGEEVLPDEAGRTARGTPKGPVEPAPDMPAERAAKRQEALDLLQPRLGTARPAGAPPEGPQPPRGEYGRTASAADAVALYDRGVAAVRGQREVGLFFNSNTGEFSVMIGSEHQVSGPHGPGWQALIHLHPNPENVITIRLPAPADVQGTMRSSFHEGSGGRHVEYVQSTLPDGTTMMTKVTVTREPFSILVEMPAHHGEPPRRIEANSLEDYAQQYGKDATFLDPMSDAYKWVMRDLDDYHAGREGDEGPTARGTARTKKPVAEPEEGKVATEADLDGTRQELERMRASIKNPRERVVVDEMVRDLERLRKERAKGGDVTLELAALDADAAMYREHLAPVDAAHARALAARALKAAVKTKKGDLKQELTRIASEAEQLANELDSGKKRAVDPRETLRRLRKEEAEAGRRDDVTIIDLTDPNELKLVRDFIEQRAGELTQEQVGQLLLERLLEYVDTAEVLTLKQSPRSAGAEVANTAQMRKAVIEKVQARGYPDYYTGAFNEGVRLAEKQGHKDGWPRDAVGRAWEVDHVAELWLGGADDPSNYLALPESLHDLKSAIFKDMLFRWRSRNNPDEQVDRREK